MSNFHGMLTGTCIWITVPASVVGYSRRKLSSSQSVSCAWGWAMFGLLSGWMRQNATAAAHTCSLGSQPLEPMAGSGIRVWQVRHGEFTG